MNLVYARFDGAAVEFGGHLIEIPAGSRPDVKGGEIVLGIRPEAFEDAAFADPSLPQLDVEVAVLEDVGADALVYFGVEAPPARVDEHAGASEQDTLIADEATTFTARVNPATAAQVGGRVRLAVDPTSFHYFDPAPGSGMPAPSGSPRRPAPASPRPRPRPARRARRCPVLEEDLL